MLSDREKQLIAEIILDEQRCEKSSEKIALLERISNDGWISVDKELPPEGVEVLVDGWKIEILCIKYTPYATVSGGQGRTPYWYPEMVPVYNTTRWMHLPGRAGVPLKDLGNAT